MKVIDNAISVQYVIHYVQLNLVFGWMLDDTNDCDPGCLRQDIATCAKSQAQHFSMAAISI